MRAAKYRCVATTLSCFLSWLSIISFAGENQCFSKAPPLRHIVFLADYLEMIGDRYDCYFTIETFTSSEGSQPNDLFNKRIIITNPVLNRDQAIALIKRYLPEYNVLVKDNNPSIFHLIDRRLYNRDDYPLFKTVLSPYDGPIQSYVERLSCHFKGCMHSPHSLGPWGIIIWDNTTHIKVGTLRQDVRSLLTNYIPLSRYNRLLWTAIATTIPSSHLLDVEIHYRGLRQDLPVTVQPAGRSLGVVPE
jgi:hypothetical protein